MLSALSFAIMLIAVPLQQQFPPLLLSGVVTNTTNEKEPVSAKALLTIDAKGTCILKIEGPLFGW